MSSCDSHVVLVLGMHRSGTSALAGLLNLLGMDAGQSLSPSDELVNPKGFWEHQDIVAVHDALLDSIGSSWDDERPLPHKWWERVPQHRKALIEIIKKDFSQSQLWVIKDPRLCRLLPLWRGILTELNIQPLVVLTVRHPLEVSASLKQRDAFLKEKSYLLWLRYLIDMEAGSRGLPRFLTTYEQLLSDWRGVAKGIDQSFSLNLLIDSPREALIEGFLEPSLRHHHVIQDDPNDDLGILCSTIYRSLLAMPLNAVVQSLDNADAAISSYAATIAPWSGKVRSLEKEIRRLAQQNVLLTTEINRVKTSFSWKVTRPLRLMATLPIYLQNILNRVR